MLAIDPSPPISIAQFIVSYAFGSWLRSTRADPWVMAGWVCGYTIVAVLERVPYRD